MKLSRYIYVLFILLISACSTTNQRITQKQSLFNSYTSTEKRLIRSGEIAIGFDENQVRMALGDPSRIKSDTRSTGTRYIWEYNKLEPDYNIFNSVSATVNHGVNAGIGIGGTPTRNKLRKRIVFERSNQRVAEFQSFE